MVPALVTIAFLVLPLAGLLIRAPWTTLDQVLAESQVVEALRLSLICATSATVLSLVLRGAAGLGARPGRVPRPRPGPGPRPAAAGPAAGRRGSCAAAGVRPPRCRRAVPRRVVRLHAALHDVGRRRRRDVRRDAVPDRHRRRRVPHRRPRLRGGSRHPRCVPTHRVPPRHPPAHRAVTGGGVGAVLGPCARRVRRHHHLRRQLPRAHPDHADRGLPRTRTRPRSRHRAVAGAARRLGRRARRPARPLAEHRSTWRDAAAGRHRAARLVHPRGRHRGGTRRGPRCARAQRCRQDHRCCAPWRGSPRSAKAPSGSATSCSTTQRPARSSRPSSAPSGWSSRTTASSRTSASATTSRSPPGPAGPTAARPGSTPTATSSSSTSPDSPRTSPTSSPAGRPSGWPWPAPSPPNPGCCCSTSRCPHSTPEPGSTYAPSSAATWPRSPDRS